MEHMGKTVSLDLFKWRSYRRRARPVIYDTLLVVWNFQ